MHLQPGKRLRRATLFIVEAATMVLWAAIIAHQVGDCYACLITANSKKLMVRRPARGLAMDSAACDAFAAQVALAHLIVCINASQCLQRPQAARRLADLDGVNMSTRFFVRLLLRLADVKPQSSSSVHSSDLCMSHRASGLRLVRTCVTQSQRVTYQKM